MSAQHVLRATTVSQGPSLRPSATKEPTVARAKQLVQYVRLASTALLARQHRRSVQWVAIARSGPPSVKYALLGTTAFLKVQRHRCAVWESTARQDQPHV